jgi:tetratricopeptide (TPR) repeat protein
MAPPTRATTVRVDSRPQTISPVAAFADAAEAAAANPRNEAPWEHLEELVAADEMHARAVLELYRGHLAESLPMPLREIVGRRAARFAAECFGENAPESVEVLRAVLAATPDVDWAFRALVVALTMAERWADVLDAYDARLAAGGGAERRAALLEEAARIAKDFTRDHGRAIGYLDRLYRMRPADAAVVGSLERLLERERRWEELVTLARARLEGGGAEETRALRLRLASVLHDELGRADGALDALRPLIAEPAADAALAERLEAIFIDERASAETRFAALGALRPRLEAAGKEARVPMLLAIAIGLATGRRLLELRRECGERLFALGDFAGALAQYEALIALAPEDTEIEDRLRQLAELSREPARLARGLVAAAGACGVPARRVELLMRAARLEDRRLAHKGQAAALFEQAVTDDGAPEEARLEALRRLDELYDEMGEVAARLNTLERLAAAEPKAAEKRLVWAVVARLAIARGEIDRALAAWQARLTLDAADVEALAASHALLADAQRWPALIDLLRRRIESGPAPHQIRADLMEIAAIARERLRDLPRAIEAWREIIARFGEDEPSVGALADLLDESGAFADLCELLERRAGVDRCARADRLARLAAALGARRGDLAGAVEWYGRALDVEPAHEDARAGLLALVADERHGARAASLLARAAEHTGSWQLLLDLVPHRLVGLTGAAARARFLEEAAALAEERANDRARAFEWLCEALPLAGGSLALEREVLRLAEETGGFARAAAALAETIAAGALPPLPLAHLHERRGALLEERLEDLRGARESYAAALGIVPERLEARRSLLRATMKLGDFAAAAALVVEAAVSPAVRDAILLPLYESLARESAGVPEAIAALADAADRVEGLDARARRELHARVAGALLGECQDAAAADAALGRALGADPGHVPTLRRRAELQRERHDDGLVDTLERLAREQPNDLDFLREAAELAITRGEEPLAVELLGRLGDHAMRLARVGAAAAGKLAPVDAAAWAIDALAGLHVAAGAPERLRAAVSLLFEGARLPAPAPVRQAWLRRAAELTEGPLGDVPEAIRVWRALHEQAPDDMTAREALARLYERERRFADVTSLRCAELEGADGADRRLALRLEIVRVGGLLEQQSRAADVLRANLAERPGHEETVRRLAEILLQKGKAGELGDVLEQQAIVLGEEGQPAASAALWAELARLAESHLANAPRAIAAWERAVSLEATVEALDALGRLVLAAGDAAAAAGWLDRRLAMTAGEARAGVAGSLATAYLAAGQRHRAVACLERAVDEQPRADDLRTRLADLYREAEAWEPLARVLAEGCEHSDDAALVVARAKEAGEAYARVDLVGRAVPVLERAARLAPRDEALRLALADGLKQCGRLDDARAELLQLVEQAGWRKSRKRAAVHHRLGELARAQGDLAAALEQLELASSMDASNLESLRQLAEVAQESGALERAERAYRALLVRRDEAESVGADALATTEILLRLFALARQRGHEAEADELLDSALATALKDPREAQRLQKGLLASGAHDVLDRLFAKRIALTTGTPAQADVQAERAEILRAQNRLDDAFEAQCLAVEAAPERAALHAPLIELARATGQVAALADRLLALVDRRRRKAESGVASAVLLHAAEIAEQDFGDDTRALELHRRAEELDPRSLVVLSGLGRLAGKRGDHAERDRVAASLLKIATEATTRDAAAEALYRAATLQLGQAESREAGLVSLATAVEKRPDLERASAIVVEAGVPQAELVKILPLYERIARQSGDERLLLDYLERQAATLAATVAEVREAVDLAVALGESERVDPLLERLAELGAGRAECRRDTSWALLELIGKKKAAGDLEGAARVLARAADGDAVDAERIVTLARELADRAARAKNPRVAAELLERVRARVPGDESVWRPLLDHYVALQDRAGLERIVSETLPLLPDVGQRNRLRLARARVLLGADGRDPAAADVLRDVLLEERRNPEALALLAKHYEACGAEDDLVDLLEQRFEAAIEAADADEIVQAALELGAAVAGASPERAAAFYERALGAAPRRRELLERLLACHEGDATPAHARRMEELLALETGAAAARLALELAATWGKLGDPAGVRRVLERGHAQAPADRALAGELERLYRGRESWGLLAGLLSERAEHEADAARAAAMLVEAAELRQQRLADAGAAVDLLRAALARTPGHTALVERLARALVASGDVERAASEVATALAQPELAPAERVSLSLVRAELEGARGHHKAAVTVLREALALAPEAVSAALWAAVTAWRASTAGAADIREATLALAELARRRGDVSHARELVAVLLGQGDVEPDLETTRLAAELAEEAGDVGGAVDATYCLMQLERGERQVAAARRLVDLAAQGDRAADAMAAVEAVVATSPGEEGLVDLLAELYEQAGERGKLAALLYDAGGRAGSEGARFDRLRRAGQLALEIGDGSMAVMALNDALGIRAGDFEASLLLADAYVVAGAPEEAATLLKPLVADRKIKPSPKVAAVHARLARIAGLVGDTKEELAAWTRALEADKKDGALVAEVADRAEAAGDLDLALKALRLIVANNTAGPISLGEAFLRQARISHRRGENDRALSFARRAAQDAPTGDAVQRAARELIDLIEGQKVQPVEDVQEIEALEDLENLEEVEALEAVPEDGS